MNGDNACQKSNFWANHMKKSPTELFMKLMRTELLIKCVFVLFMFDIDAF